MAAEQSATSLATQNADTQTGGQGNAAPTTGMGTMRAAIVSLGGEQFTIDLQNVREVFVVESITPVPGMPAGLVGVTNLRGSVVPLLDLRQMIGLAAESAHEVCRRRQARQLASRGLGGYGSRDSHLVEGSIFTGSGRHGGRGESLRIDRREPGRPAAWRVGDVRRSFSF